LKDYYRILGVLDDAEDIIIRAAYKALAQRYHPDKWKGNSDESHRRMIDINEAYSVLSDNEKRRKYDEEYFKNRARDESSEEEDADEYNFISEEIEAWAMALDFFPLIKSEYEELAKISLILANTFRAILVEKQAFKNSDQLKRSLENDYLRRYYGENKRIQQFAKDLLENGHKKAAIKVNKIVRLLGQSLEYEQIYKKIVQDFPEVRKINNKAEDLIQLLKKSKKSLNHEGIMLLLDYMYGDAVNVNYGYSAWTGNMKYTVEVNGKLISGEGIDITQYIRKNINS
jgi:curved DNA-binding protein CbpA